MKISQKTELVFWTTLLILFLFLTGMHIFLLCQPDLVAPSFQHINIKTVDKIAVVDDNGNYPRDPSDKNRNLMVNPMEEFSKSSKKYADFINNDFASVVHDINSGKRWSNGTAIVGYLLAALTCAYSLITTMKRKDGGQP